MKFNTDVLAKFVVTVCVLYILYQLYIKTYIQQNEFSYNRVQPFTAMSLGSLNDCLTTCSKDPLCSSAYYDPYTNECDVSKVFGELNNAATNTYTKKSNGVFVDKDYNEYNVLITPSAQIIQWDNDTHNGAPETEYINSWQQFDNTKMINEYNVPPIDLDERYIDDGQNTLLYKWDTRKFFVDDDFMEL